MPEKFTCAQVIEALEKTGGVYSHAAAALTKATGRSCSLNAVKGYLKRHKSVREAYDRIVYRNVDIAETTLLSAIQSGNITATIFYLKTKGRDRGYVERKQIEGPDGGPVPIVDKTQRATIDPKKLSLDELKKMEALLVKAAPDEN